MFFLDVRAKRRREIPYDIQKGSALRSLFYSNLDGLFLLDAYLAEIDVCLLAEQKRASLQRKAEATDKSRSVLLVVYFHVGEAAKIHVIEAVGLFMPGMTFPL